GRCGHQGKVEKQLALVPRREISLQFGEVSVAGDVADLNRSVSAQMAGRAQGHRSLGMREDRESVRAAGQIAVIKAIAHQYVGGVQLGCGYRRQQHGENYKLDLYSSSHFSHSRMLASRWS